MSKTEAATIEGLPLAEFRQHVERAHALLGELERLFPGMVTLTAEERLRSDGKLRSGESEMLRLVLGAVDESPEYFASLETSPLRDRLACRDLLSQVAANLESLTERVNDTVMQLGSRVRRPVLAAYRVGKSVSVADEKLRGKLARVIDFYARPAKRGASRRASRKLAS